MAGRNLLCLRTERSPPTSFVESLNKAADGPLTTQSVQGRGAGRESRLVNIALNESGLNSIMQKKVEERCDAVDPQKTGNHSGTTHIIEARPARQCFTLKSGFPPTAISESSSY
jgi:hypothetical protein